MDAIIFEDQYVSDNYPSALTRPAFGISCGVSTLYETVVALGLKPRTVVRDYLRVVVDRDFPAPAPDGGGVLYLNAALVPDVRVVRKLMEWAEEGKAFLVPNGNRVTAAFLPEGDQASAEIGPDKIAAFLLEKKPALREEFMPTIDRPFHIIEQHLKIFEPNLRALIERRGFREVLPNVFVGDNVSIADSAILRANDGPIVLDDGVTVMDFAYLSGPLYVGRNSRIIERSSIKEDTCIRDTCKIGGEVEASIVESFSNKQHHGFLGHSHVGSWVNLGAGTSNSDLKNTYGTIRIRVEGERIETNMQFFGCVIGDYSKSAINTSIFTGKIIGVSSMLYGFVSTNVSSFCNYARSFGQITELWVETAINTQKRMFSRRKKEQRPEDAQLLRDVFKMTRDQRGLATEQLSL